MVSLPGHLLTLLERARPLALKIMMFPMMMSVMCVKNQQRIRFGIGFMQK